jgi:hypothetical protein
MVATIIMIFQVGSVGCALSAAYFWYSVSITPNVADQSRFNARAARWTAAFVLVQLLATCASTLPGEWVEGAVAVACVPALLISYALPFYLIAYFLGWRNEIVASDRENQQRKWWGCYQIIAGVIFLTLVHDTRLMLAQAAWVIFWGGAILFFGRSWFAVVMFGRKKSIP